MRFMAKIIIIFLSLYALSVIIAYFFDKSLTFPFTITNDLYVPEYRLHAIRLATFSSFVYFGIRYLFFKSSSLYPIQFMGIFLFNLGIVGALCIYKEKIDPSEYLLSILFLLASLILYIAGGNKVRRYFKNRYNFLF